LSLEEQVYRFRALKSLCIAQQLFERRAGPRGHDIERLAVALSIRPLRISTGAPVRSARLRPETALLGVALVQDGPEIAAFPQEDRQNQAREAGAAAQIDQTGRLRRDQVGKLGRIPDVPAPDIGAASWPRRD
jgi:hypothetical protein